MKQMLDIPRLYVERKSDISNAIAWHVDGGYMVAHRIQRAYCDCPEGQNVRHQAALLVSVSGYCYEYVIRCKACYKRQQEEGEQDEV